MSSPGVLAVGTATYLRALGLLLFGQCLDAFHEISGVLVMILNDWNVLGNFRYE